MLQLPDLVSRGQAAVWADLGLGPGCLWGRWASGVGKPQCGGLGPLGVGGSWACRSRPRLCAQSWFMGGRVWEDVRRPKAVVLGGCRPMHPPRHLDF